MQKYEREDVELNAYNSEYDAFLRGSAALSDQELRGLALYNSPSKGTCAGCHPFKTLKDALTFYVQRDTNPEKFYPLDARGTPLKFNDLPPAYRANVNVIEVPYNRHLGDAPALSDAEIDDVIAFLHTLT